MLKTAGGMMHHHLKSVKTSKIQNQQWPEQEMPVPIGISLVSLLTIFCQSHGPEFEYQ
jgi:hypothetical protein